MQMMKILVIENHAAMRVILVKILDLMGFSASAQEMVRKGSRKLWLRNPI